MADVVGDVAAVLGTVGVLSWLEDEGGREAGGEQQKGEGEEVHGCDDVMGWRDCCGGGIEDLGRRWWIARDGLKSERKRWMELRVYIHVWVEEIMGS